MNGILLVAFGEQYDRFAAHCVKYSRKITDIPICVLTNLLKKSSAWEGVKNIEFKYFPIDRSENREIKTTMINHTPFEKTLYLDCDSIIQNRGIEKIFDLIQPDSVLLNIYGRWAKSAPSLYRKAFKNANIGLPINIYYGALCGFMKGEKTSGFFSLWNRYWKINGRGREMPSLACAVKNSNISVREISNKDEIFSWFTWRNTIIQHEYGQHLRRLVGCPDFKAYKPFDHRRVA
jgi:hypothetical protein